MAVVCHTNSIIYLYNYNWHYLYHYIKTSTFLFYAGIDTQGRLAIASNSQVSVKSNTTIFQL